MYWAVLYGQQTETLPPWNMQYERQRTATNGNRVPIDDNAVYGKVGIFGHIVHDSEIVRE